MRRGLTVGRAELKGLVLLSAGIATMWLPIHYSFYRYSIVGADGPYYVLALVVMLVCCIAGIAMRAWLAAWLARRPPAVPLLSTLTLASNGLLVGLPFLPMAAPVAAVVRALAVALYAAVFVLLFFAWIERMGDVMFQLPIAGVVGAVGVGICAVFLLVNALYGTPAYQVAALVCLGVSGVCWQTCGVEPVRNEGGLTMLPSGRTLREWSMLLAAFVLVTVLHAVTFAADGVSAEQSNDPTWLLHAGFVVLLALFAGLLFLGHRWGVSSQAATTLLVAMVCMMYIGLLIAMAAPGVLSDAGHLCVLTVVLRTLRVFIFLVLMTMCYRDAASPVSTFGLLFLLVEIVGALVCYVLAPGMLELAGIDPDVWRIPVSSATALVLAAVLVMFLAMHIAGQGGVVVAKGEPEALAGVTAHRAAASNDGQGSCPALSTQDCVLGTAAQGVPGSGVDSRRRERCRTLATEAGLTERETDIAYYLSLGFSVKKVADILCISANTVSTHSARVYRKLGVHARQELIDMVNDAAASQQASKG